MLAASVTASLTVFAALVIPFMAFPPIFPIPSIAVPPKPAMVFPASVRPPLTALRPVSRPWKASYRND